MPAPFPPVTVDVLDRWAREQYAKAGTHREREYTGRLVAMMGALFGVPVPAPGIGIEAWGVICNGA